MVKTESSGLKQIREQVIRLENEQKERRAQVEVAQRRVYQISDEIRAIQRVCPHPSTKEATVLDGAEFKDRRFCVVCGAQC